LGASLKRHPGGVLLALTFLGLLGLAGVRLVSYLQARSHREAAEQALERRDFIKAYEHLARCLDYWPDDAETHLLAARTARRGGAAPTKAEEHLRKCEELHGPAEAIRLERTLARVQQGDFGDLEGPLQQAVDADHAEAGVILEAMTQGYLRTYRFLAAQEALKRLRKREPENLQALLWQAAVAEHLHNYHEAIRTYRQVLERDPEHDPTRLHLGELLLELSRAAEAVEHFERLHERQPENPAVLLGLARCRRQLGDADQAHTLLKALAAHLADLTPPQQALFHYEQGQLARAAGNPEDAERAFRKALRLTPFDRETLFALSQCLGQQPSKTAEADAVRQRWKQLDRDLNRLFDLCRQAALKPNDAALSRQAGELCLQVGREEDGLHWLAAALRLDPDNAETQKILENYRRKKKESASGQTP
jgi:tetratricopeptide (TPR) repeat protein